MQHPESLPASQPLAEISAWEGLPYWVRLTAGFILIGLGASIAAAQLRAAIPPPEDPQEEGAASSLCAVVWVSLWHRGLPCASWLWLRVSVVNWAMCAVSMGAFL